MRPIKRLILIGIAFMLTSQYFSQSGINPSFGNAVSSDGNIHYSVGQVFQSTTTSADGEISEGVQKAFEIYVVGIEDETLGVDLNILPNPTTGVLYLSSSEIMNGETYYSIYNEMGQMLESEKIAAQNKQLDLSAYEAGLYFIHVSNELMGEKVFKIIRTQ